MNFTIFDLIIFCIVTISTIFGAYTGFINLILNILGLIATILTSYFLYPLIEEFLNLYISNQTILSLVSSLISFLCSLLIFSFILTKIKQITSNFSGNFIDKLLGLVAGFLRGIVITFGIFMVIYVLYSGKSKPLANLDEISENNFEQVKYPSWLNESFILPYLSKTKIILEKNLPDKILKLIKFSSKEQFIDSQELINKARKSKEYLSSVDRNSELDEDSEKKLKEILEP